MDPRQSTETQAGPSHTGTSRYHVQSSDVLQDMRVNVSEEGTDKVIWYKERFLDDDEIVENVVHNATNTICWTIHKPLRGWYIRIRSPLFPPGVFIPITPVPQTAPYHTDAAMSFNSRTNIPIFPDPAADADTDEVQFTLQDEDITSSSASLHSYPPTPTAATPMVVNVQPPSPSAHESSPPPPGPAQLPKLKKTLRRPRPQSHVPSSQITQFVLAPSSVPPSQQQQAYAPSFFARALSVLKSHRPSHSNSFTLSRVLPLQKIDESENAPPPPYASNASIATDAAQSTTAIITQPQPQQQHQQPILHTPILIFHDQTPVLTVRSLTGMIELDKAEERTLGVETSFWIAVALTYLEFLEERESYLAASSD